MRKIVVAAFAAAVACISFIPDADARDRGFRWQQHGGHHNGWRHNGYRHHGYYHHGYYNGHRHGGYYGGYYGGGYWGPGWGFWGGPTIVLGGSAYYDDCYVKKVRRYDSHGNRHTRRIRVCD